MRESFALVLALLLLALGVAGCSSSGNGASVTASPRPTPAVTGPTPQADWKTYSGAKDCIAFAHPPDWDAQVSGDLRKTGEQLCPGGSLESILSPCTEQNIQDGVTIFSTKSADSTASLSLALSKLRCGALSEFFRVMMQHSITTASATAVDEPTATQFGEYPATCQTVEYTSNSRMVRAHVCAIDVGRWTYRTFGVYNSDSPADATIIAALESSVTFKPLASPTASP